MKLFCETIFDDTLPAVRAIITNEMIQTYGMNQFDVAQKLGVTQPAVSQYLNGLRGKRVRQLMSNAKLLNYIKQLAADIVSGRVKLLEKVCEICATTREYNIYSGKELNPFLCLIEMYGEKLKKEGKLNG